MFKSLRRAFEQRANYRRTVNELSRLSDRELNDVGVSRGDIHSIASRANRYLY